MILNLAEVYPSGQIKSGFGRDIDTERAKLTVLDVSDSGYLLLVEHDNGATEEGWLDGDMPSGVYTHDLVCPHIPEECVYGNAASEPRIVPLPQGRWGIWDKAGRELVMDPIRTLGDAIRIRQVIRSRP